MILDCSKYVGPCRCGGTNLRTAEYGILDGRLGIFESPFLIACVEIDKC